MGLGAKQKPRLKGGVLLIWFSFPGKGSGSYLAGPSAKRISIVAICARVT